MGTKQSKPVSCSRGCFFLCNNGISPEKKEILQLVEADVSELSNNLYNDTNGESKLRKTAISNIDKLKSKLNYGILRCDYEYQPTRGDPGEPSSFLSDGAIIQKVEGWTFEAVQRGMKNKKQYPASEFRLKKADGSIDEYWTKLWNAFPDANGSAANRSGYRRVTKKIWGDSCHQGYFDPDDYSKGEVYRYDPDVIELKMKETVAQLEAANVCGITADVGYSQAFQESVTKMTTVPVVLSSLQQLSIISAFFNLQRGKKNKIVVMTANGKTFDRHKLIPAAVDQDAIKLVGLENSKFGKWVAGGNSFSRFQKDAWDDASVEEAMESVSDECAKGIEQVERDGGSVVAIVQECAELPAYTNGLRLRFNVPVYDTMTAIEFVKLGIGPGNHAAYIM